MARLSRLRIAAAHVTCLLAAACQTNAPAPAAQEPPPDLNELVQSIDRCDATRLATLLHPRARLEAGTSGAVLWRSRETLVAKILSRCATDKPKARVWLVRKEVRTYGDIAYATGVISLLWTHAGYFDDKEVASAPQPIAISYQRIDSQWHIAVLRISYHDADLLWDTSCTPWRC